MDHLVENLHTAMRTTVARIAASSIYPDFATVLHWAHLTADTSPNENRAFRDLLPVWACVAVGSEAHLALPLAAAFKLCILAAVLADDLADQDHPERPWHTWAEGRGTQVCLSLLLTAQVCLAELPPPVVGTIVGELGQAMQLAVWGQAQPPQTATFEAYYRHILSKSGLFFGGFMRAGAILGSPTVAHHQALFDYGMALGAIAQIKNDAHDLAKPFVVAEHIPYLLPVLVGLESSNPQQTALRNLLQHPPKDGLWPTVQALLKQENVAGYIAQILNDQARRARQALTKAALQSSPLERVLDMELRVS